MGRINELFCDYLGRAENYADFWNGTQFHGVSKLKSDFLTCGPEITKLQDKLCG